MTPKSSGNHYPSKRLKSGGGTSHLGYALARLKQYQKELQEKIREREIDSEAEMKLIDERHNRNMLFSRILLAICSTGIIANLLNLVLGLKISPLIITLGYCILFLITCIIWAISINMVEKKKESIKQRLRMLDNLKDTGESN